LNSYKEENQEKGRRPSPLGSSRDGPLLHHSISAPDSDDPDAGGAAPVCHGSGTRARWRVTFDGSRFFFDFFVFTSLSLE